MNIADAKQAQPQALMPWKAQDQPKAEVVKRCAWVKVKTGSGARKPPGKVPRSARLPEAQEAMMMRSRALGFQIGVRCCDYQAHDAPTNCTSIKAAWPSIQS